MGLGKLKSTTIVGDKVIDSETMNTELYPHNQQTDPRPTPPATPTMKYQKPVKKAPKKANPVVPARGSYKKAAEDLHAANAKDLNERNIK